MQATHVVNFYQNQILAVEQGGQYWVSVRHVCTGLGIQYATQYRKLKEGTFNCCLMTTVGEDRKPREMFCIAIRHLNGWLFSISPAKVKPEIREKLRLYQLECHTVLYQHFMPNGIQDLGPLMGRITGIEQRLELVETRQKGMTDYASEAASNAGSTLSSYKNVKKLVH